jgi:hypothetical protein
LKNRCIQRNRLHALRQAETEKPITSVIHCTILVEMMSTNHTTDKYPFFRGLDLTLLSTSLVR